MKKLLAKLIVPLLFLAGLSLLLYPLVSNEWNTYRQSQLITTYDEEVAQKTEAGAISYDTEMLQAKDYNNSLQPYILPDSFATAQRSEEADERYMSCLNLTGNGMMGYVQIPKIDVKLPIFHTTEEEVLQTAAGHLEGSSLPVGGVGNHAVISAHRGLPSATLFTDLDRLVEGDYFLLYILDEVLCYQVDEINVVDPEDTTALAAEDGKDLVTLLTCTPYGVNSHRLLVRGSRVPYEEIEDEVVAAGALGPSLHTNYLLWVIVGLSVTGSFILLLFFLDRKKRKAARQTLPAEEAKGQEPAEKQPEGPAGKAEGEPEEAEQQERPEKQEGQTEKPEGQTERQEP